MNNYKKYLFILILVSSIFSQTSIDNLSSKELELIKKQINQVSKISNSTEKIADDSAKSEIISIDSESVIEESNYFGYNFFNKDINFFDNVPTPPDFKLGPGDEIILSLWGQTNAREKFTINKNGLIFYEKIGFINLLNKTIEEAEDFLKKELAVIYSTLEDQDNQTELMLELSKIKSINVYFTGHVNNVGVNLIHPFSDIFSALIQAGGINQNGSLRNVQLIRSGEIISTFDFYSFFVNGENIFSKMRIIDGDTIHVPTIEKRVLISGAVYSPGFYESNKNESYEQLLDYSGGLNSNASSSVVIQRLIPLLERDSNDTVSESINTSILTLKQIIPNNGDSIRIIPLVTNDTMVEVVGKVKSPGKYSADSSLKEILDIAGGFNDPEYAKNLYSTILILRKDESQASHLSFYVEYKDSESFEMNPGDKIVVYSNQNYNTLYTVNINGEVNKAGSFPWKEGMTIEDLISKAGGLKSSLKNYTLYLEAFSSSVSEGGKILTESTLISNIDMNTKISNGSKLTILPTADNVQVLGNVYKPSTVAFVGGNISKYIEYAGGKKPKTKSSKIYITRANGEVKKVGIFRGRLIRAYPGDIISVPLNENEFDTSSFISDLASTLANIVAIIAIADKSI